MLVCGPHPCPHILQELDVLDSKTRKKLDSAETSQDIVKILLSPTTMWKHKLQCVTHPMAVGGCAFPTDVDLEPQRNDKQNFLVIQFSLWRYCNIFSLKESCMFLFHVYLSVWKCIFWWVKGKGGHRFDYVFLHLPFCPRTWQGSAVKTTPDRAVVWKTEGPEEKVH